MDPLAIGLSITPDFISATEEAEILSHLDRKSAGTTKERNSVRRFGSRKPYNSNMVSADIPAHLDAISAKLVAAGLVEKKVDSVSVNEYHAGQTIRPHIDSQSSGETITILSLCGPATMVFTRKDFDPIRVEFPPRAVLQMSGDIRHKWMHTLEPVKELRYSIVFRQSQK